MRLNFSLSFILCSLFGAQCSQDCGIDTHVQCSQNRCFAPHCLEEWHCLWPRLWLGLLLLWISPSFFLELQKKKMWVIVLSKEWNNIWLMLNISYIYCSTISDVFPRSGFKHGFITFPMLSNSKVQPRVHTFASWSRE